MWHAPSKSATSMRYSGRSSQMTVTILVYDQLLFRPLVTWADKFRYEQTATQNRTKKFDSQSASANEPREHGRQTGRNADAGYCSVAARASVICARNYWLVAENASYRRRMVRVHHFVDWLFEVEPLAVCGHRAFMVGPLRCRQQRWPYFASCGGPHCHRNDDLGANWRRCWSTA